MTDTAEQQIVDEALKVIDQGLSDMAQRELVSTNEVSDLLLDLRTMLTQTQAEAQLAAPAATV